jgi:hypothetical protein
VNLLRHELAPAPSKQSAWQSALFVLHHSGGL